LFLLTPFLDNYYGIYEAAKKLCPYMAFFHQARPGPKDPAKRQGRPLDLCLP